MTLLELKTNSRSALDEASAALFTDADIIGWINAAERDIAAKTGCLEVVQALTTASGSRLVTFTGNKINAVELVIGGVYSFLPGGELAWEDIADAVWQDTTDTEWYDYVNNLWIAYPPTANLRVTPHHLGHISKRGETVPNYWFQWSNYVVIEPVPDATYNLNVYVSQSPSNQMSADGDAPQISYEFQDAIVPFVVAMAKLKARKYGDAAMKYNEYISTVQSLIDKYIRRNPARIRDIRLPDLVVTK